MNFLLNLLPSNIKLMLAKVAIVLVAVTAVFAIGFHKGKQAGSNSALVAALKVAEEKNLKLTSIVAKERKQNEQIAIDNRSLNSTIDGLLQQSRSQPRNDIRPSGEGLWIPEANLRDLAELAREADQVANERNRLIEANQ